MPFVRYARDRRGYETVYVMHAFEGAEKNPRVRVLYACRTVPHAKVGRLSLDEGVQRRIEQAYPSLKFEWPRLLKEAAASAPRPERPDPRTTGEPRGKQRRERKGGTRGQQVPQVPSVAHVPKVRFPVPGVPQVQQVQPVQPIAEPAETPEALEIPEAIETPEPLEPVTELIEWTALEELDPAAEPEPEPEPEPRTEPGEPLERAEPVEPLVFSVGPLVVDRAWPVVGLIGADRALVLRGRYIELAHRVLSRVSSPAERNRLLREAIRLNPETWTTEDQAREGVAGFEAACSRLAEQLRQPSAQSPHRPAYN